MNIVNLVSVNKFAHDHPSVFIDTIASVQNLLERCGFTCITSTNNFYPELMNIIWGAGTHFSHDYKDLLKFISPKNSVIFNMEQIESVSTLITEDYIKFLKQFLVFDYNQHNLKALNKRGIFRAVEFPLIPSPKFKIDYDTNPLFSYKYDLAFYGTLNNRRINTLRSIENTGLKIKYIHGSYGQDLSRALIDCLAVINIHYYESAIFEAARCLRPLAMGIPVISEFSQLPENIKLTLVGNGDLIQTQNNRIKIVSFVNKECELINKYDSSNIVVLPSFTEAHPKVVDEALSRLRPVIIFDDISYIVSDRKGVFVAKRNLRSFNRVILNIKENHVLIEKEIKKNILPKKNSFLIELQKIIS